MSQSSGPLKPGDLLAGRHEIHGLLGSGGMGWVYEAHDRALGERVAVKVLKGAERGGEARTRFMQEVKLARRVRHKNVAAIHDYGEDGDLQFITMALVSGQDLRQLIHEKGPLPWDRAYAVAAQIGAGLGAAHDEGVIHRDLKPANVMVEPSGLVRVMDFGVAKSRGGGERSVTPSEVAIGTPEYMSPEQVRGGDIDVRSDLYAFGVVIFEIFTGRVPFLGQTPVQTMLKHLEEPPPLGSAPLSLPGPLVPVLLRALAKDPRERYASCREMLVALEAARHEDATDPVPVPERPESGDQPTVAITPPSERAVALPTDARLLLPMLIQALKSAQVEVRMGAVRALEQHGPSAVAAVPALQDLLADPEVKEVAAAALRSIGPLPEDPALPAAAEDAVVLPPPKGPIDPIRAGPVPDSASEHPEPGSSKAERETFEAAPPSAPPSKSEPRKSSFDRPAERPVPDPSPPAPPPVPSSSIPPENVPASPVQGEGRRRPLPMPPSPPDESGGSRRRTVVVAVLLAVTAFAAWLLWPPRPPAVVIRTESTTTTTIPPAPEPTPIRVIPTTTTTLQPRPEPPPPTTLRKAAAPTTTTTTTTLEPVPTTATTLEPAPTTTTTTSSTTTTTLPPLRRPECKVPKPDYPLIALQRRQEGTVVLRVLVGENDKVMGVKIVRAVELLTDAAVRAARAATCSPARRGDVPVEEWLQIDVKFELPK
jgi:serine/threonine-protein kinase